MKVTEARELAERLGYRIEKHRGEDKWIIRDLHTDVRVAHGLTFASTVAWLERAHGSLEPGLFPLGDRPDPSPLDEI
jgi:hypothetical protein